jgi:hypothetical protein
MVLGTGPSEAWALVAGVVLVAVTSVPFGLAVGALATGTPPPFPAVAVTRGVLESDGRNRGR